MFVRLIRFVIWLVFGDCNIGLLIFEIWFEGVFFVYFILICCWIRFNSWCRLNGLDSVVL